MTMSSPRDTPLTKSRAPRQTLAEEAAAELLDRIMSGELPAGSPLRLVDLASQLEMSPMPVREGLRRLEALGIVEIQAHKGARVRDLSLPDLDDTQRTRLRLESIAIELAAANFTRSDADAAATALAEFAQHTADGSPLEARRAHAEFHFCLYRASRSRWLIRAIEPVWQNSERYRFLGPRGPERVVQSRIEHEALLVACEAGDPTQAVAALEIHLNGAAIRIRAGLEGRVADSGSGSRPGVAGGQS